MPKVKKYYPSEQIECEIFANWLRAKGLMFTYIANDTWTPSWSTKGRNKKLGTSSGVPDYMIIIPPSLMFIEMKKQKGGKVSENQKIWIDALRAVDNVDAYVCNGAEEAIKLIEEFTNNL